MALSNTDITERIKGIAEASLVEVTESFVVKSGAETHFLDRVTSYRDIMPVVVWRFSTSLGSERYLVSQEHYDMLEKLLGWQVPTNTSRGLATAH